MSTKAGQVQHEISDSLCSVNLADPTEAFTYLMIELFSSPLEAIQHVVSTPQGVAATILSAIGLALSVAASFVRTMVKLRALAVCSSILLLCSALVSFNVGAILLFCLLVPLNIWRLLEIRRLVQKVDAASATGDLSGVWLKPYMKAHTLAAGEVLFHKGEAADYLYLLVEGECELVEIGRTQAVGELFGEISFFSPERVRTLTAKCQTRCLVLSINEATFRQLYFQNPKFAFEVVNLLARRLGADIHRMQNRINMLEQNVLQDECPQA